MSFGNDELIKHIESCDNCIKINDFKDFLYSTFNHEHDNIINKLNEIQIECATQEGIRD